VSTSLLPTTFTAAFPHDHSMPVEARIVDTPDGQRPYLQLASWISVATLTGLPATVAPVGRTAAGLPAGIQIVAPMWEDGTSIELAALLADVSGGFSVPAAFETGAAPGDATAVTRRPRKSARRSPQRKTQLARRRRR
jgi:amidase